MPPLTTRTDYAAVNAHGVTLCTFGTLAHAKAWVRERSSEHDGLHVRELTYSSRVAYRPNLRLVGA